MIAGAFKPNLLCIVPPYTITCPPAGAAALLGYLKANGCDDFSFLDLRLHVPYTYAPTFRPSGVFGESYVLDVPDLPLTLHILRQHDAGRPLTDGLDDEWFVDYCVGRGIHPQTLRNYLRHMDRFLERAFAQLPDLRFVGFSTWTSNYLTTLMAASHLKRRRQPPFIVAGGPQVTESKNSARLGLKSGLFDAVALGEGEETLLMLYEAFCKDGKRVDVQIPGTMQLDSAGNFTSSEQPLLRLKELPLPSFDEMQIGSYRSESRGREIPYQLSRGCTDKCSFCSEWVFWRKYRLGSATTAVDQITQLVGRYGAELIHFTDSLLNGTVARLQEFAETMLSRDAVVPWFGFMRAEMDPETAALIRRAGCVQAFLGIESMSDETLAIMNKRRTEADNIRALRTFLHAGIRVRAGLIPGFPGDNRERFIHTARVLVGLQKDYPGLLDINTEPFILSPGQPISRELDKFGLATQPWPSELVDGAGKYGEIASQIACTFTGPNQGVDRLGGLKIAETLLGASSRYKRLEELHSPLELDFSHLRLDVFLARTQSGAGHTYALLVTHAEKEAYERMRSTEAMMAEQDTDQPLLDRPYYRARWDQLESKHVVHSSRDRAKIFASTCGGEIDDDTQLQCCPFVVARVFGVELMVVRAITLDVVRLPAAAAPWFASVANAPRTVRELAAAATAAKLRIDIPELVRTGFLEVCASPTPSRTFTGRVPPAPPAAPPEPASVRRLPVVGA